MKKLSQIAAVVALGTACALPVMAQTTPSSSSAAQAPATQSTAAVPSSTSGTQTPATSTMGAGPDSSMDRHDDNGHRDMGWIGLLGLAGLLGLRRRHDHDDRVDTRRTTTAR